MVGGDGVFISLLVIWCFCCLIRCFICCGCLLLVVLILGFCCMGFCSGWVIFFIGLC